MQAKLGHYHAVKLCVWVCFVAPGIVAYQLINYVTVKLFSLGRTIYKTRDVWIMQQIDRCKRSHYLLTGFLGTQCNCQKRLGFTTVLVEIAMI